MRDRTLEKFEGISTGREVIDLSEHFKNIEQCLNHYRLLKMHCESALDEMTLRLETEQSRFNITSKLWSTAKSKALTATLIEHIERQMEMYQSLCRLYDADRRYNIVHLKYFEMPGAGHESDQPYTNAQLADYFDCSVDTIQREIKLAREELKILFFGG